jgi:hypothetical protein
MSRRSASSQAIVSLAAGARTASQQADRRSRGAEKCPARSLNGDESSSSQPSKRDDRAGSIHGVAWNPTCKLRLLRLPQLLRHLPVQRHFANVPLELIEALSELFGDQLRVGKLPDAGHVAAHQPHEIFMALARGVD